MSLTRLYLCAIIISIILSGEKYEKNYFINTRFMYAPSVDR